MIDSIPTAPTEFGDMMRIALYICGGSVAVVVLFLVFIAVLRRLIGGKQQDGHFKKTNPNEGKLILVVGRLGSGKTGYAVHRAASLAKKNNLPVYSNANLRPDWPVLASWVDLDALPRDVWDQHPGIIVLDELHMWLSSDRTLQDTDDLREAVELLSYARKRGWTIIATTQAKTRVHTTFRQLVAEYIRVSKWIDGVIHLASLFDIDTEREEWHVYSVFSPMRGGYNTRAEVTPLWKSVSGGNARKQASRSSRTPAVVHGLPGSGGSADLPPVVTGASTIPNGFGGILETTTTVDVSLGGHDSPLVTAGRGAGAGPEDRGVMAPSFFDLVEYHDRFNGGK